MEARVGLAEIASTSMLQQSGATPSPWRGGLGRECDADTSTTPARNPTPAEIRFWRTIWPLRHAGHHFRKQVALGPYVVDFACHAARLVIEVDGDTHFTEEALAADQHRDDYLRSRGYRVLRFTNADVMGNGEGVFQVFESALAEAPPSLPSPRGGG